MIHTTYKTTKLLISTSPCRIRSISFQREARDTYAIRIYPIMIFRYRRPSPVYSFRKMNFRISVAMTQHTFINPKIKKFVTDIGSGWNPIILSWYSCSFGNGSAAIVKNRLPTPCCNTTMQKFLHRSPSLFTATTVVMTAISTSPAGNHATSP